jgi:hypothetical protein
MASVCAVNQCKMFCLRYLVQKNTIALGWSVENNRDKLLQDPKLQLHASQLELKGTNKWNSGLLTLDLRLFGPTKSTVRVNARYVKNIQIY